MAKKNLLTENFLDRFDQLSDEEKQKTIDSLKERFPVKELPHGKGNSDEEPDSSLIA